MASPQVNPSTSSEPDWTDQVTGLVVDTVDAVRDKSTGPVLKIARGLVFGVIATLALLVASVVGLILVGRALFLLPVAEWIIYLVLGVVFSAVGLLVMKKRIPNE